VITDTHAHLFWESFRRDLGDVLARARRGRRAHGGRRDGRRVFPSRVRYCAKAPDLYPPRGSTPTTRRDRTRPRGGDRRSRSREDCVGVGRPGSTTSGCSRRARRSARTSAGTSSSRASLRKPVVVHCRDAHEDTWSSCARSPACGRDALLLDGAGGAPPYLELGFSISFSGMVTYPKNEANPRSRARGPADRILFETDCPLPRAAGTPRQAQRARVDPRDARRGRACLRGADAEELADRASANAAELFRLPARPRQIWTGVQIVFSAPPAIPIRGGGTCP
jgi:TatD DNase family protein